MNKFKFLKVLSIIGFATCLLSCESEEKAYLSYGYAYDSIDDVYATSFDTTYNSLSVSVSIKESFVALVYSTSNCSCYVDLKIATKEYLFENKIAIKTIKYDQFDGKDSLGIKFPKDTTSGYPILCVFKEGKLIKQLNYSANDPVFVNLNSFKEFLNKYTFLAKVYKTSVNYVDTKINNNDDDFLLSITQESCPDCQNYFKYVTSNLYQNYDKIPENYYYVVDKDYNFDNTEDWTNYKNRIGMAYSETNPLGYVTGRTPTMMHYKNGNIIALNVFLNDFKEVDDSGIVTITDSYYSSEMVATQDYLENNQDFIIKGKTYSSLEEFNTTIKEKHSEIAVKFLEYHLFNK